MMNQLRGPKYTAGFDEAFSLNAIENFLTYINLLYIVEIQPLRFVN